MFEPRLDKDGVHRRDKSGGTNLPLYAVKLVAWSDADAETILVTVAVGRPAEAVAGTDVSGRASAGDAVGAERQRRGWRFVPSPSSRSTAPSGRASRARHRRN